MCAGVFTAWAILVSIPSIDGIENRVVGESTKIYDRTGNVLLYDVHGAMRRTEVPLDEISPISGTRASRSRTPLSTSTTGSARWPSCAPFSSIWACAPATAAKEARQSRSRSSKYAAHRRQDTDPQSKRNRPRAQIGAGGDKRRDFEYLPQRNHLRRHRLRRRGSLAVLLRETRGRGDARRGGVSRFAPPGADTLFAIRLTS